MNWLNEAHHERYHLIAMSKDTVFSITQSILSIIIVLGGGFSMLMRPEQDNAAIVGLMSAVITYFFTQSTATRTATQTATNMQAASSQATSAQNPAVQSSSAQSSSNTAPIQDVKLP